MTVEDRRGNMDPFPVGLRVLAVDDDPTCLKVLERLLRRCQYNVTVTNQAITALKLLRENTGKFDLVISDVHMPDMDGFKLLELVGLEMDLPVIMLSANGDTQMVMKGITHGACDYLLKPVRLEELKNIWQHVIRRKRYEKRCHNQKKFLNNVEGSEDDEKTQVANTEGANGATDHSETLGKKRKDQSEEYEDDSEDNFQDNEDGSAQKKPRVVWTVELHQKFVAAVNQLGVDKAVPKKILDLMNVENITRENVASHLQKYRLYLKRISTVAGQQGSLAAALAGRNSYIHMTSFNGYRNYNALGGSRQLPNITAYQPNRYLGRINTSSSLGMNGLLPSQTVQLGGHKNASYSFGGLEKPQDINALRNHQVSSIQGVQMKLELDGLEQTKILHEAKSQSAAGFSGSRLTAGVPVNSFPTFGNSTVLQPKKEYSQAGVSGYCSSIGVPSTSSDPFEINFQESSRTAHLVRCDSTWQGAVGSEHSNNSLPVLAPFTHSGFSPGTNVQTVSSVSLCKESNVLGESSNGMSGKSQHDSDRNSNVQSQIKLLGDSMMPLLSGVEEEPEISRLLANSQPKWDDNFASNALSTASSNSSFPNFRLTDTIARQQLPDYSLCNVSADGNIIRQTALAAPDFMSNALISNSITENQQSYKDEYGLETAWWQDGLGNGGSLDDILNSVVKPV